MVAAGPLAGALPQVVVAGSRRSGSHRIVAASGNLIQLVAVPRLELGSLDKIAVEWGSRLVVAVAVVVGNPLSLAMVAGQDSRVLD